MATSAIAFDKAAEEAFRGAPQSEFEPLIDGLTPELEKVLISIVDDFARENYWTWRGYVREWLESEAMWKGFQYGFYNYERDEWRVPSINELAKIDETGPRFDFETNIYRAFGWSLIAVLGQKRPTVRFLPSDFRIERDIVAARGASDVVPIIERNNRLNLLHIRACYMLYTQGGCASYTRHLVDGERFGYNEEPGFETVPIRIQEAGFECPECFGLTPFKAAGEPPQCVNCGRELSESDFRPEEVAEAPRLTGVRRVPRGQEVVTLHSNLEIRVPPHVQERAEWPFLGLEHEVHVVELKKTYGKRAESLQGYGGDSSGEIYDRRVRLAIVEPNISYYQQANPNLVTFKHFWLRPSAFYQVKDEKRRQALLDLFPGGVAIAFADRDKLLDARKESMDDHWRYCRAMEGPGAYTPALGQSAVSVQKRTNVLHNFIMEWVEYSAAGQGTLINANLVDVKALRKQRRAPGIVTPVKVLGNQPLGNAVWDSRPGAIAGEIFRYADQLQEIGRFVTGATPTVTGGTEMSLKPTTFLADREQALGRLFVPWAHLKNFWAETVLLAVKCFAKYRTEDEAYTLWGPRGEFENRLARISDLDGNFDAYPETDENFPQLWQQMQAVFMQLMQSPDPFLQSILGHAKNVPFDKAMLGLPNLFVPGEDDIVKQEREIALLLEGEPIEVPGPTGQPVILPSIQIDEFEDMHSVHAQTVREWAVSPNGLKAREIKPLGYKNVIAHGKMHDDYDLAKQAGASAGQAAPQSVPPSGATEEPGPAQPASGNELNSPEPAQ